MTFNYLKDLLRPICTSQTFPNQLHRFKAYIRYVFHPNPLEGSPPTGFPAFSYPRPLARVARGPPSSCTETRSTLWTRVIPPTPKKWAPPSTGRDAFGPRAFPSSFRRTIHGFQARRSGTWWNPFLLGGGKKRKGQTGTRVPGSIL